MVDYTKPVPVKVRKPFSTSYSQISTFQRCEVAWHLGKNRIHFGLPPYKQHPKAKRGEDIHKMSEDYINNNIDYVPDELSSHEDEYIAVMDFDPIAEEDWLFDKNYKFLGGACDYFDKRVMIRGKADIYFFPEKDIITFVDIKTGRIYPTHRKQAEYYVWLAWLIWPDLKLYECEFWYVDQNHTEIFEYTNEQVKILDQYWRKETEKKRKAKVYEYKPSANACRWCEFHIKKGGVCEEGI